MSEITRLHISAESLSALEGNENKERQAITNIAGGICKAIESIRPPEDSWLYKILEPVIKEVVEAEEFASQFKEEFDWEYVMHGVFRDVLSIEDLNKIYIEELKFGFAGINDERAIARYDFFQKLIAAEVRRFHLDIFTLASALPKDEKGEWHDELGWYGEALMKHVKRAVNEQVNIESYWEKVKVLDLAFSNVFRIANRVMTGQFWERRLIDELKREIGLEKAEEIACFAREKIIEALKGTPTNLRQIQENTDDGYVVTVTIERREKRNP